MMMMIGCHGYSSGGAAAAPVICRDSQSATSGSHREEGARDGTHILVGISVRTLTDSLLSAAAANGDKSNLGYILLGAP